MIPKTDSVRRTGAKNVSFGGEMKRGWLWGVVFFILMTAENQAAAKEGFYFGGEVLYNVIDGDFDGINGPDADPGPGLGLVLGYGFTDAFALQLDWNVTLHNAAIEEGTPISDAGYGAFILGFKYHFMTDRTVQPFFRAGVGVFSFKIEDPLNGDLVLNGKGFDLGLGADYALSDSFSIGAGISRRFVDYDEFKIQGIHGDLEPKVSGDTISLDVEFIFHFD